MSNKSMSWNDRFALLDHYVPDDDTACQVFGVSQGELDTARDMRKTGAFTATPGIDVESYSNMFTSEPAAPKTHRKGGATSTKRATTSEKPMTATKKVHELKKRGRKGDKIITAFQSIPEQPIPAEQFATDHGVSLAVLRQSKRFDRCPERGTIHVKKDRETKTLMIWRDSSAS